MTIPALHNPSPPSHLPLPPVPGWGHATPWSHRSSPRSSSRCPPMPSPQIYCLRQNQSTCNTGTNLISNSAANPLPVVIIRDFPLPHGLHILVFCQVLCEVPCHNIDNPSRRSDVWNNVWEASFFLSRHRSAETQCWMRRYVRTSLFAMRPRKCCMSTLLIGCQTYL